MGAIFRGHAQSSPCCRDRDRRVPVRLAGAHAPCWRSPAARQYRMSGVTAIGSARRATRSADEVLAETGDRADPPRALPAAVGAVSGCPAGHARSRSITSASRCLAASARTCSTRLRCWRGSAGPPVSLPARDDRPGGADTAGSRPTAPVAWLDSLASHLRARWRAGAGRSWQRRPARRCSG